MKASVFMKASEVLYNYNSTGISLLGLVTVSLFAMALMGCNRTAEPVGTAKSAADKGNEQAQAPPVGIADRSTPDAIQFVDVTDAAGIEFVHDDGSYGKFLLPETMSGGVALFDFDGDQLVDIYFCNGRPLDPTATAPGKGAVLYKNLGGLRFREVSQRAGLSSDQFGLGVTTGDYDNDGFPDLLLTNFGGCQLLQNAGDGTFIDVTSQVVALQNGRFAAGASFLDANGNGLLDLFIANYVRFSPAEVSEQANKRRVMYPGPQDFPPETSLLLFNDGDANWTDVSVSSGIAAVYGTGMGCVAGDFDQDGSVDIYLANDELPNSLFQNDGLGKFEEVAVSMGVAVDNFGIPSGSMGVDAGDLDNDGHSDLIVTTFENESIQLYRMTQAGVFQDATRSANVGSGTLPHVTWGCCIADFDNDGDRDLYIASGHLDQRGQGEYYRVQDLVLKNMLRETQHFRFQEISHNAGAVADIRKCGRGAAVADLDNDGDLDVVVSNLRDQATLLENRSECQSNHWLQLRLVGVTANRSAVGAKVRVTSDQLEWVDEVRNGRGYQSYWGAVLHFGLGNSTRCEQVEIQWPGGERQRIENLAIDQQHVIVQQPIATRSDFER